MRTSGTRHRLVTAYLLGVASLLAAELAVAGVLVLPKVEAVAGSARPAPSVPTAPTQPPPQPAPQAQSRPEAPAVAEQPPAQPPPAPQGQRPGTIRLPDGGTAKLVRKEIVGPNAVLPVPANLDEATWWGVGLDARGGASVFAGHVNWRGRVGPFAELWHVKVGEQVSVTDHDGKSWTYRVSQVITLHKDELPQRADELFSQYGDHRVVLVTCGGRWLGGATGYAENRVVIAEPVS